MTFHPERPSVPSDVFATVRGWLADAGRGRPDARVGTGAADAGSDLELTIDGIAIAETPITIEGDAGRVFGIIADPPPHRRRRSPVGALFLNAGAVRRIGPNRVWVDTARRWAAQGVPRCASTSRDRRRRR